ncbi:hypothetical protein QTG56_25875 (plasmid) [Rossellomorea sp. AcN35-11]|nr:hypothetical protein [Rossellomorea aquimaris]WJV32046.1 hypothetical protein QTG56_25875 [Rossellomorea sp. AcN35-11]
MGYQESFVIASFYDVEENNKGIARLLELFQIHDVRMHDDWLGSCVAKIHFLNDVYVSDFEAFRKGMDMLWVTGDRQCQRGTWRLFDYDTEEDLLESDTLSKEDKGLILNSSIIFLEEVRDLLPKIIEEGTGSTEITELKLEAPKPKMYDKVQEFFNAIEPVDIYNDFNGSIFSHDSYEGLHERILKESAQHDLPLVLKKATLETMDTPKYQYLINENCVASYNETPHSENKGTWYINGGSQDIRKIARSFQKSS